MANIKYLTVPHLSTKDLTRIFSRITFHPDIAYGDSLCWIWSGTRDKRKGYGTVSWNAWNYKVHRLLFAWLIHPLPTVQAEGELDHLCRRTGCCNPVHMEFVSTHVNILRSNAPAALNARKTHCKYGHSLTPDNTLSSKQGYRLCKQCKSLRNKRAWHVQSPEQREAHRVRISQWRAEHREHFNRQARKYRHG